jgi:hypothetical protein
MSRQALEVNWEMGHGILKFSSYYETAKFPVDHSD